MCEIAILLGTYNGSKYIIQQLNSLFSQELKDYFNLKIYISDDGSTDNTISLIKQYSELNVRFEIIIINTRRLGGVQSNFAFLINNTKADYYFFCDQDDLWLPYKIITFIEHMELFSDKPTLIYSDLCVVNEELIPQHLSMFRLQKLKPIDGFNELLVQNSITGCACAFNNEAAKILRCYSISKSIMHDWYAALIISAVGKLIYVDKATLLYRQHSNNQVGAKQFNFVNSLKRLKSFMKSYRLACKSVLSTRRQALLLEEDIRSNSEIKFPRDCSSSLRYFIGSFESSFFDRVVCFTRLGMRKSGFLRNVLFFIIYVFFGGRILGLSDDIVGNQK